MPYFITDKSPDCSGWATIKEDGEVIGCHETKQDAIDHMVAVSLAEDMEPGGERNSDADVVIIVDIDGTLIAGGRGIQKNVDYVNELYKEFYIYIVTGRSEDEEDMTISELADAGVQYDDIQFNEDMSMSTPEYKKMTAQDILEENPVKLAIDNDAAARRAYSDLGIATMDPKIITADEMPSIRQVSLEIPVYIRTAARKGLDYYGQGLAGEGLVDRTVREARDLARGDITEDKVIRSNAWAQRHAVDLDAPKNSDSSNDQFPGAGAVAHYLWGINPLNPQPARDWYERKANAIKAERGLFNFYRTKSEYFANIPGMEDNKVETRRIQVNEFELRAGPTGDGMSFTGYAAVFNSDSEPLPFIERIAQGAFKKSLKSRQPIKMYMNHDSSMLLASTRSRTLRLEEDSKGLLVNADLPDTTVGRDLSVLMQRGDVDSMSFGFSVPAGGDSWSDDGMTRELRQVRLHEVSVVTGFPAYKATSASVRSLDLLAKRTGVDADKLAEAITMLESGNTLSDESAELLSSAVSKLRAEPAQVPASVNILAKHLELLKSF
jgi:HK97 family phage prohead protease